MAATCASCQTPTESGVRSGAGVLCPRCATVHSGPGCSETRPVLRRVPGEAADDMLGRRELTSIVESREEFQRRLEEVQGQLGWQHFLATMVLLLAPPSALYLRWHDLRTLAWLMTGMAVWSLVEKGIRIFELTGRRRSLVVSELESVGAYRRYRQLREDLRHLDPGKQRLLRSQILPKLKRMMEEKLPYLLQRRFEFASFLRAYRFPELESRAASLEETLRRETDPEVRDALGKRLGLARSRRDHYADLERRMRLHQIHLENLESHMENLVARVVMLDPNDDFRKAAESIMQGLTEEVEVLEEAYRETGSEG